MARCRPGLDQDASAAGHLSLRDLDAERAVIAAIFIRPEMLNEVSEIVRPDHFYLSEHGDLFHAAQMLSQRSIVPDPMTVACELKARGLRGETEGVVFELMRFSEGVPRSTNARYYARIIRDLAERRRVRGVLEQAAVRTADPDVPLDELHVDVLAAWPTSLVSTSGLIDETNLLAMPPRDWLVRGLLAHGELGMLTGPSGSGKTAVTLALAAAVTSGQAWLGLEVPETAIGAVVYVAFEGAAGLPDRIRAWKCWARMPDEEPLRGGFAAWLEPLSLVEPSEMARLMAALRAVRNLRLVAIDTWARAVLPGNENHPQDAGRAIAAVDAIRRSTGACVLVLHHLGATGERERGSTALRAACDVVFRVTPKHGGLVEFRCEKLREGLPPSPRFLRLMPIASSIVPMCADEAEATPALQNELVDRAGALRAQHPEWSRNKLAAQLGGNRKRVLAALRQLDGAER